MNELAILYSRVSTDVQDNSLHVQDEKLRGYLLSKGLETRPGLVLADEDVSGRIPIFERPGGRRALQILREGWREPGDGLAVRQHPVNHIICKTVDRLGRNAKDCLTLYEWFQTSGKVLHVMDLMGDQITTSGMMGKMFFAIAALFAEFEVETIRERIRTTFRHKMGQGELIGTVPFGFEAVPTGRVNPKSGKEIMRLEPNPGEQAMIRHMAEWRRAGWSLNAIAKRLNALSVPTKTGPGMPIKVKTSEGIREQLSSGQWHAGQVKKLLSSKHTAAILQRTTDHAEDADKEIAA